MAGPVRRSLRATENRHHLTTRRPPRPDPGHHVEHPGRTVIRSTTTPSPTTLTPRATTPSTTSPSVDPG